MKIGQAIVTENKYGVIINVKYDPPDADVYQITKELLDEFIRLKNKETYERIFMNGGYIR